MEAASARYAARDRWADTGHAPSQLQRFIQAACSPENYEPNLALNLEVADLINSKKGSTPREAATTIVGYINHRTNHNVALLALNLLDICVKNCGYPFHLQISTKEFLNELVRRFPERPPLRPTRVQMKILEAIEEWRSTICETSKYRDDLGFVRDMHRLLAKKGYTFPEVRRDAAAVLNPSDNLKSAEEMEEEEREAQSAKLQELIRRGTPEDLQAANRLMKVMAGYDTRSKVDYRAKAAEEVGKIQQKARLLEERLATLKPGDPLTDGDVYSEIAASLQSAQPKIQKMCEEESDDTEAVAKLLEINDSIHRTVERYRLLKKGDFEGARAITAGGPPPSSRSSLAAAPKKGSALQELSLIDFDTDVPAPITSEEQAAVINVTALPPRSSALENDLLDLSIGEESSICQAGSISLDMARTHHTPSPIPIGTPSSVPHIPSIAPLLSTTPSQSTTPQPSISHSAFASPKPPAVQDPFANLMRPQAPSKPATLMPPPLPFSSAQPVATTASATSTGPDDDEWAFSSALPPETPVLPREQQIVVTNSSVRIDLIANRSSTAPYAIQIKFSFTNNTAQLVSELHFQLAVTKGFELALQNQSGRTLEPKQSCGIIQVVDVWHAIDARDQRVESVRLRWRISYKLDGGGGEVKAESGEISEIRIA